MVRNSGEQESRYDHSHETLHSKLAYSQSIVTQDHCMCSIGPWTTQNEKGGVQVRDSVFSQVFRPSMIFSSWT
jgi:hypothetical protein